MKTHWGGWHFNWFDLKCEKLELRENGKNCVYNISDKHVSLKPFCKLEKDVKKWRIKF